MLKLPRFAFPNLTQLQHVSYLNFESLAHVLQFLFVFLAQRQFDFQHAPVLTVQYIQHACCLNFMFAKRVKNVSFCLDGEMIFPQKTQTKESILFNFAKVEEDNTPTFTSQGAPNGKIMYRNIQWRAFVSVVLHSVF